MGDGQQSRAQRLAPEDLPMTWRQLRQVEKLFARKDATNPLNRPDSTTSSKQCSKNELPADAPVSSAGSPKPHLLGGGAAGAAPETKPERENEPDHD